MADEPATPDLLERFDLASMDVAADRRAALREVLPEAITEDGIDLDVLQRTLGDWVDPGPERFGLTWPGKAECMRVIQQPSIGTLVPMRVESVDFDTTENVIIEGDNLEVLKLLQKSYYGKVKLIYIDPPYNTGKEFIYPDNFKEGLHDYLRYSGQVDEEGLKLSANTETDGRYHSKWLSMMYPRLFLARNLLREDGVIFVSIDDHEVHNLRALMNEIFGEENFIAEIAVVNNRKGRNDREGIATTHEYLLMFQRGSFMSYGLPLTPQQLAEYRQTTDEGDAFQWRDLRKRGGADTRAARPNLFFPIFVDPESGEPSLERTGRHTVEVYPRKSEGTDGCWRWGRSTVAANFADLWGFPVESKGKWNISYRVYLESAGEMRVAKPKSTWEGPEFSTDSATKALRALIPEVESITPKPVGLVRQVLVQTLKGNDMCVDFFSGTGTTGQAVMEQNHADGEGRRFLLVQLPEPVDIPGFVSLASITRERVRRAASKIGGEPDRLGAPVSDLGFRAYRLTSSNFSVWDGENGTSDEVQQRLDVLADNVVEGRTQEDLLTELLMKAGYPLTAAVEMLDLSGKVVFSVDNDALLVCLEGELTIEVFEAMAERDPSLILVLDTGFGDDDELKVNALQTIRARKTDDHHHIELKVV